MLCPVYSSQRLSLTLFNSNDKSFGWQTFADDKFYVIKLETSVFDGVENIVGKGEYAGYQHFLLFPAFQNL